MAEICAECKQNMGDITTEAVFCDSCHRPLHKKPCSGLNASEIRVMELRGTRMLRYHCKVCRDDNNGIEVNKQLKATNETLNMVISKLMAVQESQNSEILKLGKKLDALTSLFSEAGPPLAKSSSTAGAAPDVAKAANLRSTSETRKALTANVEKAATTNVEAENQHASGNDEVYQLVTGRRHRRQQKQNRNRNIILGSGTFEENENFAAPAAHSGPEKAMIYIGRIKRGISSNFIENHIKKHCPELEEIDVEKLTGKGLNQAFRLTVDFSFKDRVMSPNIWPCGIVIRRFFARSTESDETTGQNFPEPGAGPAVE